MRLTRDLTPAQLTAVRTIYEDAFDDRLRRPFDDLLADDLLGAVDGDQVRAFVVLRDLGPTPWTFMRYLAVGDRGRGTGSLVWPLLTTHLGGAPLVWDVEDPDEEGVDDEEVAIRRRRIGFYQRLGGILLPVGEYREPDGTGSHPMRLMAVDDHDLRAMVLAVYRYRYELDADHPLVQGTLKASKL